MKFVVEGIFSTIKFYKKNFGNGKFVTEFCYFLFYFHISFVA